MDPKVPNSPVPANFCCGWPKVLIWDIRLGALNSKSGSTLLMAGKQTLAINSILDSPSNLVFSSSSSATSDYLNLFSVVEYLIPCFSVVVLCLPSSTCPDSSAELSSISLYLSAQSCTTISAAVYLLSQMSAFYVV